jgi:uncharacterized protein YjbI with pentapeptide repeats
LLICNYFIWILGLVPNFTILFVGARFLWEIPQREKQAKYQAWGVVHTAHGQKVSGARISALEDLRNQGESLAGLRLEHDANLAGIDLSKADLSGAILVGVDLRCSNLSRTYLIRANLSYANLSDIDLSSTYLNNANLSNANLSGANFGDSNLGGVNLSGANFSGANFIHDGDSSPVVINMMSFSAEQIKSAKNWGSATYNGKRLDIEFSNQLGWDAKP